jgi:hypothetical protein
MMISQIWPKCYALKQLAKRSGIDIAQSGAMAKLFASQTAYGYNNRSGSNSWW